MLSICAPPPRMAPCAAHVFKETFHAVLDILNVVQGFKTKHLCKLIINPGKGPQNLPRTSQKRCEAYICVCGLQTKISLIRIKSAFIWFRLLYPVYILGLYEFTLKLYIKKI